MTSKELLYIEDALGHESFMKTCCQNTAQQIKDTVKQKYTAQSLKKQGVSKHLGFL